MEYWNAPTSIKIIIRRLPVSIIFVLHRCTQARSQKFAMGGCFGGLGAEHPAAGGQWGSGGEDPSCWRHGGLGAEPPALKNFAFFYKNNLILEVF